MASSDSSRVGAEPTASDDHHTTSSSYHPHPDVGLCGPSDFNVNPVSAVGPSDVDVNTLPAVNPNESCNALFTIVTNPVANRQTLYGFEIHTLDSMFTSGNVYFGSKTANLPDQSLSVDTTSTATTPTSTEQHLQFIRFETEGILYPIYVKCELFNDILLYIVFTTVLYCKL
ncbi:hypothetical protein HanOQP8_Chr16g0615831 [Helianthus annuus]|nr:hypothetical protein HanOQP8_Chr16g0615831 [Helianthus annuus]